MKVGIKEKKAYKMIFEEHIAKLYGDASLTFTALNPFLSYLLYAKLNHQIITGIFNLVYFQRGH